MPTTTERQTEEKPKFTPGPWMAASRASSIVGLPVVAQTGRSIASVSFFDLGEQFENHQQESYANARLIAAAPDLLAALKSLHSILEEVHAKWDEGQRAGKLLIALLDPTLRYRGDITAIHAAIAKVEG